VTKEVNVKNKHAVAAYTVVVVVEWVLRYLRRAGRRCVFDKPPVERLEDEVPPLDAEDLWLW